MRVIFLGPPGAGKGTQAHFLCNFLQIPNVSTGDRLRQEVQAETELGKQVKEIMAAGLFPADELIIALVKKALLETKEAKGFLLDGFPRTVAQAEALKDASIDIDHVIELEVADEVIIQRLSGRRVHLSSGRIYHVTLNPPKVADIDDMTGEALVHREDDKEAVIRKRLEVYHDKTKPLVHWYQRLASTNKIPVFSKISGEGAVEIVRQRLVQIFAK